jgi:hypothetical protein
MALSGSGLSPIRRWGDGNGFSHIRAALMGASAVVPDGWCAQLVAVGPATYNMCRGGPKQSAL